MTHRSSADTHQPGQPATAKKHTDTQVPPQSSWGSGARTDRTPDLANSYLAGHHDYVIAQTYAFGVLPAFDLPQPAMAAGQRNL